MKEPDGIPGRSAGRLVPRRVYFVPPWSNLSGAPICALEQARLLGPDLEDARLVLADRGPLGERAIEAGVRTECFAFEHRGLRRAGAWKRLKEVVPVLRSRWRYVRGLRKLLREKPGILHIHSRLGAGRYAFWSGVWAGAPIVLTLHEVPGMSGGLNAVEARLIARFANAVVAVSAALAREYEPLLKNAPVRVVHNFTRLPAESPHSVRCPAVLAFIGPLGPHKGFAEFLQLCANLHRRRIPFAARIVGDWVSEAERERGEEFVRREGLRDFLTFCGTLRDMDRFYPDVDVVAVPSHGETFGLVALEGMAHGLPVVACDVGGLPELVEDGISGYLVPVGDVEHLTDRVQRLLEDADLRKRMGAAGRERAARLFDPETHRRKMLEIYAGI